MDTHTAMVMVTAMDMDTHMAIHMDTRTQMVDTITCMTQVCLAKEYDIHTCTCIHPLF